jgi:hypothetical protein
MSNIYEKIVGDKTLVLTARDGFMRKFNFGSWTDMAVGMYFTGIVGNNSPLTSQENLTIVTHADRIAFGLKNSTNTILPGFEGSYFVGMGSSVSATNAAALVTSYGDNNGSNFGVAFNGTTIVSASLGIQNTNLEFPANGGTGVSSYNGFWVSRFTISNRGLSNQSIAVKSSRTGTVTGTDYSTDSLFSRINNVDWNVTPVPLAWNDGVNALPIPDAVWIRMPFYTNIIRISSVAAVKFT